MRTIITLLLLCLAQLAVAQRIQISGEVQNPAKEALPYATILLLKAADSAMTNYAVTDVSGKFIIKSIKSDDYILKISYTGYQSRYLGVSKSQETNLDFGQIQLAEEEKLLSEVEVKGERIPMLVKNDTIEYDALAFKARPNEVVEDMLKRMPGMEVESDGTVKAQGEEVRRVTVDGKEFFGRDPKMATQNLPADAVSKVQVFDRKSEQAQFSGIDDGVREKTINLELKEDRKSMAFGNNYAGYGTDNRFESKLNINRFNKGKQFSVLGMANNINQSGFSMGDYMNFSGGAQSLMGGGGRIEINLSDGGIPLNTSGRPGMNGIMTTIAGGLNTNQSIGKKTEVNASYFYNRMQHDLHQDTWRENFMPDGSSFDFEQNSRQNNISQSHKANVRLEHKMDSSNSLLLIANAGLSMNDQNRMSESRTFTASNELQNESEQNVQNIGSNYNINSELLWRHRFSKKGRTLQLGSEINLSQNESSGSLNAINSFYGDNARIEELIQENENKGASNRLGANLTFTEPLGKKRYLETNYRISNTANSSDQLVFDMAEGERELNELLTNQFVSDYLYQRAGLNVRFNRDNYNFTLGTGYQFTKLSGASENLGFNIDRNFQNLLPVARFNYNFAGNKRLGLNYETSVQEPNVNQLQPIVDNRDPLNISVGNPELQPAFRNSLRLNFNSFNPMSFVGYFIFINADYVTNAITYAQSVDESLVRTTTPANVSNTYNVRGNFNFTFPLRAIKSRVNMGNTITRSQNINLLNDTEQVIFNNMLTGNLRYNFRPIDDFEINLTAMANYQLTEYQFRNEEQAFLNQNYGAELFWSFLKDFRYQFNYNHMIFQGVSSEFDQIIPLMDMSIARSFLKNKSLEAKISANNLMDCNLGVTQSANANYLERQVTNNLGRYFMLTLTYSLNKQLNMMDGGRRGGGMRMMVN